jgi:hypothetical protein
LIYVFKKKIKEMVANLVLVFKAMLVRSYPATVGTNSTAVGSHTAT